MILLQMTSACENSQPARVPVLKALRLASITCVSITRSAANFTTIACFSATLQRLAALCLQLWASKHKTFLRFGSSMFRLGVIVNPYAGLGGTVGLKGSDGAATVAEAISRGAEPRAIARMQRALKELLPWRQQIHVYCLSGDMGESCAVALELPHTIVGHPSGPVTSAQDTCEAARILMNRGVDLIVFAGGDGTARNIADAVGTRQAVLGVPSG